MKVTVFVLAAVSLVIAEPPVPSNQYLPVVSTSYGAPIFRNNVETSRFRSGVISSKYTTPQQYSAPSIEYGVPAENGASFNQYNIPSTSYGVPVTKYGVPGYSRMEDAQSWILFLSFCVFASATKRDKRGEFYVQQPQFIPNYPTQATYEQHANTIYTPISSTPRPFSPVYSNPTPVPVTSGVTYVTPSNVYNPNNFLSITESTKPKYVLGGGQYGIENEVQYVTPSTPLYSPAAVNTEYVAPVVHNQYAYLGDQGASDYSIYNYAPGHSNYQYDVKAPEYGVDFGQYDIQEGDVRRGRYYVLLPDGRRQVVNYIADSTGYHPKITYEYVGNVIDHGFGVHY